MEEPNILHRAKTRLMSTIAAITAATHAGKLDTSRPRLVGRHHPGPVGNGQAQRSPASQRERARRRHAKRAAKARG